MKIIYHSYSGNTRAVAEKIHAACGGTLVEVRSTQYASRLTAYTVGCYRAMKGLNDPIVPGRIDCTADELLVIGTPVWAGRATPAINGAVAALENCTGKRAIVFATCGKEGKDTLPLLKEALAARGVTVAGAFVFDRQGLKDPRQIDAMIAAIKDGGGLP